MDSRLTEHLKRVLGLSEDEWNVVSPRMEAVLLMNHQRERFSRTRPPKASEDGQPRDIAVGGDIVSVRNDESRLPDAGTANAEMGDCYFRLISLASQPSTFPADFKESLNRYRAARAKSDAELANARSALRELMTARQEAVLVVMGILDQGRPASRAFLQYIPRKNRRMA